MIRRSLFIVLGVGLIPDVVSWEHVSVDDPRLVSVGATLVLDDEPLTARLEARDASGALVALTHYVDGRRHGMAYRWFENGRLHSSRCFDRGTKQGLQIGYWPNGELRFRYVAESGVYAGTYASWHENGQQGALRHFVAGRESGAQKTWDRSGTLLSNYVVRDGRRYGLLDSKPCFTVDEGVSQNVAY